MKVVVVPAGTNKSSSWLGIKGFHLGDALNIAADWVFHLPDLDAFYKSGKQDGMSPEEAAALAVANAAGMSLETLRARLNAGGNDSRSYIELLAAEFEDGVLGNAELATGAFDKADTGSKSPAMNWLLVGGVALLIWLFAGKRRGRGMI